MLQNHPSPFTVNVCFPQLSFLQKRVLSHVENMPLSHPGSQGAQRGSYKRWLITAVVLVVCSVSALVLSSLPLKAAADSCQAKFGPLPSKWQTVPPEPSCMNKTSDWKLTVLQNGLYLIYGQVVFDTTYNGVAPLEVQLRKNKDAIQTLKNNFKIQTIGGTYELHAGDTMGLIFNSEDQILKNNTYWGIVLVANLQFTS
uniref:Tumor necrosis factor ligand superfamily member 18 n=1 Tax=Sciurus vulgaris TaxID=55149 RepID=A0A8D2DMJ7_SCIVU